MSNRDPAAKLVHVVYLMCPGDDEPLAYFPYEESSATDPMLRGGYAHFGQHCQVHPEHAAEARLATTEERSELHKELVGIYEKDEGCQLRLLNEAYPLESLETFLKNNDWSASLQAAADEVPELAP